MIVFCAAHFQNERPPKVLLTTCLKPSKVMYTFLSEMLVGRRVACFHWMKGPSLPSGFIHMELLIDLHPGI